MLSNDDVIMTSAKCFDAISLVVTRSHLWSLVVTRGHSCSTRGHSWSLVVTRGHSWSLVVTRGHSWSFVVTRGHSCVLLDRIENRSGKREFQLRAGAGFRVFEGSGCENREGLKQRETGLQILRIN